MKCEMEDGNGNGAGWRDAWQQKPIEEKNKRIEGRGDGMLPLLF